MTLCTFLSYCTARSAIRFFLSTNGLVSLHIIHLLFFLGVLDAEDDDDDDDDDVDSVGIDDFDVDGNLCDS